jgi:formate dehydrogenase maturation protein FdhE
MAELAVCQVCGGAGSAGHVHKEMGKDLAAQLYNAIQDLKVKYPKETMYCPVCGAKL